MDNLFLVDFLDDRQMVNMEQAINIHHLLAQVILLKIPGDVVELGCHTGNTSAIMQKTLDMFDSKKNLHVYDSFQGLPKEDEKDKGTIYKKGWAKTEKNKLIKNFKKFKVKLPKIHEGWFKDTLPTKLPLQICFAHLDGDFYSSIKESLENIYPKLSKGAIVVIDDYSDAKIIKSIEKKVNANRYSKKSGRKIRIRHEAPGVKRACDEFFKNKKEKIIILLAGEERHAYFRKI